MRNSKQWLLNACLAGLIALDAKAQYTRPILTKGVGIEQKLNSQVPLDVTFRDERGNNVPLRTYFGKTPVVLAMVYYRCPNVCDLTLNEITSSLKRVALVPASEYNVVVVSIDPAETSQLAAEKKANYAKQFGRTSFNEGWHFLTGQQDSISRLASALGFNYRWDERTSQFVHGVGIMVATPEGKVSRYFYGVQFAPADVRLALAEASEDKIGSPVNAILLFCFHYDATQGKYTLAIFNLMKVAGTLTIIALGALIYFLTRNDKRRRLDWKEAHHVG